MGTALTTDQIKIVRRHLSLADRRDYIAVATDADPAGWKAAQTAFWNLTAADLDPTHLPLPEALDPASLFATHGPQALAAAINDRVPLGDVMLDQLLRTAGHWSDPKVRQQIVEQAARILAARGPDTWTDSITRLNQRLHLSTGLLEHQTLTESIDRDHDLAGYTRNRITELQQQTRGRIPTKQPAVALSVSPAAAPSLAPAHHREIPAPGGGFSGPPR
jgi:DNA primase